MNRSINDCSKGFTLLESVVVLAVISILVAVAIPMFDDLIKSMRVRVAADSVVASLNLARSEAIKRGGNVSINMAATGWSDGFRVRDTVGNVDLKNVPAFDMVAVTNLAGVTVITVDRWGKFGVGATAANFSFVPTSGGLNASNQRAVCVSLGGRITLRRGVTSCS